MDRKKLKKIIIEEIIDWYVNNDSDVEITAGNILTKITDEDFKIIASGKVIDAENPIIKEGYLEHQLASIRLAKALAENIGKNIEIGIREVK